MRTALRIAGRIGLWTLTGVTVFMVVVLAAVVLTDERSDSRIGAAILLVPALGLLAGCVYGLRHTRRVRDSWVVSGDGPGSPGALDADARARLRAGQPIVLTPSRRRWTLLLLTFAAFTACSVWAFTDEPNVVFGAGAVLFGAGLLLSVLQLVPGRAYLRIAPDGLVMRTPLKTRRLDWNDVENFTGYEIQQRYGSTKHVGFDRRDLTPERQGFWKTVSRGMTGVDGGLPDTYGFDHEELARLLNKARDRYATEHGLSPSARADRDLMEQAARVRQDRIPLVTAVLVAACVAAFAVEAGRYGLFPDPVELFDAGGAWRDGIADGRWWTLLSANLLHANPIHLVLNLVALAILGVLLEREVGWLRFGVVCVVSGVAAMGLAVLIQPGSVTVGISGVVFAISAWAVMRDTHRTRTLGVVAWATLPIGLIYTFLTPGISIGAHVGGLLAGLAFGYAFERVNASRDDVPVPA